jgi:hypothetical protein
MASKPKTIGSTEPRAKTAIDEGEALLDPTREQEIRNRAYEIYLQRGTQPGSELEDWLQAKHELGLGT